jgi:DNA-binding HxlR family transcriptional regulator
MNEPQTHSCHCENSCGVGKTLKIIGSKWTMHLLHHLFEGKKRFGELQRELEGISPKTLSVRLKELEDQGLLSKKLYAEVPLHVEYSLTKKGKSLQDIFNTMAEWGENN